MKGIVFNLLEESITAHHGSPLWEELLAASGSDGVYMSLGSYPDRELQAMVMAAAMKLGLSPAEVLRWFGKAAMPLLIQRYPEFFARQRTARALLLSVKNSVHPEVLKIYPGAGLPELEFRDAEDGGLLMSYRSPRNLCALAHGFAEGTARYFGEEIEFTHLKCVHRGDDECLCHIAFEG
ncbi:MAG: heme NO-binding domain-containing protein [Acidobacteriota bacterium]